ncbi:MAG: hypothetical protein SFT81_00840 [Candidatus Caenarcaniphilales bacterium]|nr:hypothetical protein [Candidatus Caenarcaniphilales bacterium]
MSLIAPIQRFFSQAFTQSSRQAGASRTSAGNSTQIYNQRLRQATGGGGGLLFTRLGKTLNNVWGWRLPFYLAAAFPFLKLLIGGVINLFESNEAHRKEGIEARKKNRLQAVIYSFLNNQRFTAGLIRVGCASAAGVCLGLFGIWSLPLTLALWFFAEQLIKGLKIVEDAKALDEPDLASEPSSLQEPPPQNQQPPYPQSPPAPADQIPPGQAPNLPSGDGLPNPGTKTGNLPGNNKSAGQPSINIANQQLGVGAPYYLPGYGLTASPGNIYTKYETNNYYGRKQQEDDDSQAQQPSAGQPPQSVPQQSMNAAPIYPRQYGGRAA